MDELSHHPWSENLPLVCYKGVKMQENTQSAESAESLSRPLALSLEKGYFHSCTVRLEPEKVFALCADENNLQKVIHTLPDFVRNRIELNQIDKDIDEKNLKITWSNKSHSQIHFRATLILSPAPVDRGTYLSAEAFFEAPRSKFLSEVLDVENPEPSMLVSVFLRRLKALFETGEIATIKGQPHGSQEIAETETLH